MWNKFVVSIFFPRRSFLGAVPRGTPLRFQFCNVLHNAFFCCLREYLVTLMHTSPTYFEMWYRNNNFFHTMHKLNSNTSISNNQSLNMIWFNQIPEAGRFLTSTGLGNIIFYLIDQTIYNHILIQYSTKFPKIIQRNKESASFFVSYFLQIVFQHYLNALFVYGLETVDSKEKYLKTLLLTYSTWVLHPKR